MKIGTQPLDSIQQEVDELFAEGSINLNLGCGKLALENALNCDLYNPDADKNLDAKDLSEYVDGTVNAIYAMHLLEHFDLEESTQVLKEWKRALRNKGYLIIGVPDMEETIKAANQWDMKPPELWKALMFAIYGCQNGEGQVHKWGYSAEYLVDVLDKAGFTLKKIYRGYPRRPTPSMMVIVEKRDE